MKTTKEHTTHFDDCGCVTRLLNNKISDITSTWTEACAEVKALEERLYISVESFSKLHDHLDPKIKYGNCIACNALSKINGGSKDE